MRSRSFCLYTARPAPALLTAYVRVSSTRHSPPFIMGRGREEGEDPFPSH